METKNASASQCYHSQTNIHSLFRLRLKSKLNNWSGDTYEILRDLSVFDNEGLGRKSSKRCCIFHKQRAFGESSTESSDEDSDYDSDAADSTASDSSQPGSSSTPKMKKIARKKKTKKVPDHQRFHA